MKKFLDFKTDTFRINDVNQEVNYSKLGISTSINEMDKSNDILLNKSYNKILEQ